MGSVPINLVLRPTIEAFRRVIPKNDLVLQVSNENSVVDQLNQFRLLAKICGRDAETGFQFATIFNFRSEQGVRGTPFRHARQAECFGQQTAEHERRADRSYRGDGLKAARQPIVRVPQVPHFHHMSSAAGHDESSEQHEYKTEWQIAAFAYEPQ